MLHLSERLLSKGQQVTGVDEDMGKGILVQSWWTCKLVQLLLRFLRRLKMEVIQQFHLQLHIRGT